jgi:ribonuclease BN (tRNA processing enzyme)
MKEWIVQFLGSGDAFGCGGRFQTCIYVQSETARFLIDCGASSLIAMKRFGVDPNLIESILLTHLHGDHFGGIPFLIRETQILSRRTAPLFIAGPPGLERRIRDTMENLFPGSPGQEQTFPLRFIELSDEGPSQIGPLAVHSHKAIHTPGTHPHSLRVEWDGKVLAYTGDTEWTEDLVRAADGADLLVCESFTFEKKKNHLDYQNLLARWADLRCRRLILTHMSDDMLSRLPDIGIEWAEDGKQISLSDPGSRKGG